MKKKLTGIVLFAIIILTSCTQSRNIGSSYVDDGSSDITYQQFYDDLSPYGQWVNNPDFGYVWAPRASGFRPYYSNGRWAYTNYGWTWVSDYDWGWATFHYGRWFQDSYYGWMWVPGYEWAPAWVSWRQNSSYYGWAPLCPRRSNGSYYEVQNDQWAFVPNRHFNSPNLNNYYVNNQNNITIINNTTIINKTRIINNGAQYQEGPAVAEVERVTNAKVRTFAVKQSNVPGDTKLQGGALHIYKPVVKNDLNNANSANGKPVLTKGDVIRNQPQADGGVKNAGVKGSINKARNENVTDNGITSPGQASAIRDKQPVVTEDVEIVKPSPATINTNGSLNGADRRRKEIRKYPQRESMDIPQTPVNTNPNTTIPKAEINRNNAANNNVSPGRVFVKPSPGPANTAPQQRGNINQQQQNPAVNQRPATAPDRPVERTSRTFESRPAPAPQSPPSNTSPQNNGIKKVRSF